MISQGVVLREPGLERHRALGRKLEVISCAVEPLLNLVYHRRSLRVECYIVLLILAEILL